MSLDRPRRPNSALTRRREPVILDLFALIFPFVGENSQPFARTTMRKIILMMSVSLDGFIEGPDRQIDWHLVDDELHHHFNEQLRKWAPSLNGRVTYELMADFWPTADTGP